MDKVRKKKANKLYYNDLNWKYCCYIQITWLESAVAFDLKKGDEIHKTQ
jgi:hypothetical protein